MTVNDFIHHAEELANDGRPAWCRSAIRCAYYAAHHATVNFLFDVGVRTPSGGQRHAAAFNALIAIDAATDQPVRQAGSDLSTLHGKRNRADYNWDHLSSERQDEAHEVVEAAKDIIAALEACLTEEERVDAITAHFQGWVPRHGHLLGLSLV